MAATTHVVEAYRLGKYDNSHSTTLINPSNFVVEAYRLGKYDNSIHHSVAKITAKL